MSKEAAPLGRRDRRKVEARQRLMSAAREVAAQTGLRGLRISDVTARADLGFGTFYTYFDTKEALVEALLAEALEALATTLGSAAQAAPDPAQGVADSYRWCLRFGRDEPELAGVLLALDNANSSFEEAVRPWARDTLVRGQESGRFDIPDIELCIVSAAATVVAAIRAILEGRIESGPATESRGAEMMLRYFGIKADEAHRIAHRDLSVLTNTHSD